MKFIILKEKLEEALGIVGRAITNRNVTPILSGVKLELNSEGLYLTASDTYISIITKIPVFNGPELIITPQEHGVAVIGARNFAEIVRKFDGERLEIETIDNILKVKDDTSDFSLNCMDANDYPDIDIAFEGTSVRVKAKEFAKAISQTAYAASEKDTRAILQGVNLKANGSELECIATDSFRIAKKNIILSEIGHFSVTITAKLLNDIAKVSESEDEIEINISEKKVSFNLTNTLIITGLINGSYPDTSRLIPTQFTHTLEVNSSKLIAAIDRNATLSTDRLAVFRFSLSSEEVKVMSRTQETGSGSDTLKDFKYIGDKLDISFTSKYVIDAIKAIGEDEVMILFNSDTSPAIIKGKKDDSVLALILPVRTY